MDIAYKPDPMLAERQAHAAAWFAELRDRICAALEGLEDSLPAGLPFADLLPGRFMRTPWQRTDHAGGPGGDIDFRPAPARMIDKWQPKGGRGFGRRHAKGERRDIRLRRPAPPQPTHT